MLKKELRLRKRSAFNATYKTGKCIRYHGITMFYGKLKNNNIATKAGFVVSKKIHKRAVKRNRIKRLMRECYRLYIKQHSLPCKYISVIFIASASLLEKDFNYINAAIIKLAGNL